MNTMRKGLIITFLIAFSFMLFPTILLATSPNALDILQKSLQALVPPPEILLPVDGKVYHNFPRKLLVKWKKIPGTGITYDVEVDCLHCRKEGEWASQSGTPWVLVTGLTSNTYEVTFPGDNPGRVRVRAVKGPLVGQWSPWIHFSFRTGQSPPPVNISEDCISFDPDKIEVKNISGSWKIVQGSMWLLDFGNNMCQALQAYRIIRHYGLNKQCFVARPNAKFHYWLINNSAPAGSLDGEDCIYFNPSLLEVKYVNGRWKIVEGSHWLFDFGNKKNDALLALEIIKKYKFNQTCFVGRPNPKMEYLRK
ncbi:MAG TPA: fibronectin type III domain-containing protein [Deltaproteobacteria bacterium]|nr:fibronectin type III domain-containing protein [Deltaproteobacteria bacterium]